MSRFLPRKWRFSVGQFPTTQYMDRVTLTLLVLGAVVSIDTVILIWEVIK